jgi:hypothetical protein
LTKKILVALLPMTEKENAKIAMRRILGSFNGGPITVSGLDLEFQIAGTVTSFNEDQTPDLKSFVKVVEHDHDEFIIRLQNIRDLY